MLPNMKHFLTLLFITLGYLRALAAPAPDPITDLRATPATVTLVNPQRPHSLIVQARTKGGYDLDHTATATYRSSNDQIARVDAAGWIHPVANGQATITATAADRSATVNVTVKLPPAPVPFSFRQDVMPVLSKGGCNAGACHGYSLGKNGFKLSLRGADPEKDYPALTDEFLERRINRHQPAASLLLLKPLGDIPHEGGVRFDHGGVLHETVRQWIAEGAKDDSPVLPTLVAVTIFPEKVVALPRARQQFQLVAKYSDGSTRDVSRTGIFTVNTERVARVDETGLVTATDLGETAIVARYEGIFAVANLFVLPPDKGFQPTPVPQDNLVDRHVVTKLNDLRIKPSDLADDERFLRRVSVDLIGVQPKPDEVTAFTASKDADKRAKAIAALMKRPEFIDWWSLKWGDLLQNSRNALSDPAVYAFREWIRASIARNVPLDVFAREILTARGSYLDHPAAAYFAVSKDTDDTLQRATQVFAGVRMLCAKCHPHPFEHWTQGDYYGVHSFFNQVTTKADPRLTGVANAKTILLNLSAASSTNPRTGKPQPPRYLGGGEPKLDAGIDRRADYAKWLTSSENPHFARSLVNRVWSYFFHRGIIDPVDDLRSTSPPINAPLLDALTKDFVAHQFDLRHLMQTIVTSRTYQRSSLTNDTNGHDDANFSHAIPRRLPAEALLDSLVQATGVKENFSGAPAGFTAAQLPDANVQSPFLSLFGKPQRMEACECERDLGANMLQALHFINGKSILDRVASGSGRPALLLAQKPTDEQLIEQLYLWSLARRPAAAEIAAAKKFLATYADKRAEAAQDFMWGLLNSRDFTMLH
ncbi:surface protein [Verrucomicrobiota bacterium]|nr:surface protein [Verrucomicrobiota bacterium]